ncbi:MAG: hypothetical protein H8E37_10725 [Planctomycetes bacterium]|nr:hypothetical protein [Planctomycetota bacterium]
MHDSPDPPPGINQATAVPDSLEPAAVVSEQSAATGEAESESTDENSTDQKPTGFAAVGRRISRRTTDLLAIAVIGMGIFAVSGRLSDWWNTTPESVIAQSEIVPEVVGAEVAWPEMDIPVAMNLGDFPVRVERLLIQGDLKKLEGIVFSRLESVLRSGTSNALPHDGESKVARAATKLEGLLTKIDPVRQQSDAWQIYRLDEPGTPGFSAMFIGTRLQANRQRILTWAMAMPWRQKEWKVFFFQPAADSSTSVVLPPGAELTMSMQEPSGTELAAFRAMDNSSLKSWQAFYSRSLSEDGWTMTRPWSAKQSRSTARFENGTLAVELILRSEDDTLSGLASVIRLHRRSNDD